MFCVGYVAVFALSVVLPLQHNSSTMICDMLCYVLRYAECYFKLAVI